MKEAAKSNPPDAAIAALLGVIFLALYLLTLCRTVFWYDSAEYVTAAVTLGIPHPPGYPLYTIIGHVFTWLPVEPAIAVNAMSATFAAVAVALTYLVCRRLGAGRVASSVGAAILGGSKLFWVNAVVAEVYCPAIAVLALVLYLLLRSRQENRFGLSVLAAYLAGLGLGIHLSIATVGLGLAFLVWAYGSDVHRASELRVLFTRAGLRGRVRRSLLAGGASLLGSLIFLYLPLRARQHPPLNIGNPTSFHRFEWVVTGGNFKSWFVAESGFGERLLQIEQSFQEQLHLSGLLLAAAGLIWLWRRRPVECLALVLMSVGNIGFFFRYAVHDLAVFFLPTTFVLCCFVGVGAQALIDGIGRVATVRKATSMQRLVATALTALAGVLALGNYRGVDMSRFDETTKFIGEMSETLPEEAIILNYATPPEWKLDAVFGMYVQKVLQERTDVEVVVPVHPHVLDRVIQSGRPLFAYAPVAELTERVELVPRGPIYEVLGPRPPTEGSGAKR